jgi:CheY-like chemotaxis protein
LRYQYTTNKLTHHLLVRHDRRPCRLKKGELEELVFRKNVLQTQTAARPKVLTVSRDKLLVNIRQNILSRVGYTVTAAENATEALMKLASQSFDLMILCHTLTQRDKNLLMSKSKAKHIPVLSITDPDHHKPKSEVEVDCLDLVAGFVEKVRALTPHNAPMQRGRA